MEQKDQSGTTFNGPPNAGNGAAVTVGGKPAHLYGGHATLDKPN